MSRSELRRAALFPDGNKLEDSTTMNTLLDYLIATSLASHMAYILLAITVSVSSYIVIFSKGGGSGKYFNGPRPLPIIGNLLTFNKIKSDPDGRLKQLVTSYGGLCMLWLGGQPVLIVSDPLAAKQLLNEKSASFSSRPVPNAFRQEIWPWRLVSMPAGDDFRFVRRLYNTYLNAQSSKKFRAYQDYEALCFLEDLLNEPDYFLQSVDRYTTSVIFSAVHGFRLKSVHHPVLREFTEIWNEEMKYFEPGSPIIDFIPILQYLPKFLQLWRSKVTSLVNRESELHLTMFKTLQEAISRGKAPNCFARDVADLQEKERISELQVVHILAMLVGAGSDTTASVLQTFFKIIALHPDKQALAQAEIDRVVGRNRLPDWGDEHSLPYTFALIKEVHRYGPIGSLGIPHSALKDEVYRGKLIPKDTIVFPNLTSLSSDTGRYAKPDKFLPERFLGDSVHSAASVVQQDYMKRDHFHYGFGRRACPGVYVAESSLFIVITRILWAFSILPKDGAKSLDLNDKTMVLVWKQNPFELDITPRDSLRTEIIKQRSRDKTTEILDFDDVIRTDFKK